MDLATLSTGLRRFGFTEKDPLTLWLNAAQADIEAADEWTWSEEVAVFTLEGGEYIFGKPDNFKKPIKLKDITDAHWTDLEYYDIRKWYREVNNLGTMGVSRPDIWTISSEQMLVYPTYQHDRRLDLLYLRELPPLVNAEDVPAMPSSFHFLIVLRAAAIGLMSENEEERAQTAQSEYEFGLAKRLDLYTVKQTGEPEQVQDTADYYGYGSYT